MAIWRTFYCDGPDCRCKTTTPHLRPEMGFLTITGWGKPLHFCGWDCVLRHAATIEPETVIPAGSAPIED